MTLFNPQGGKCSRNYRTLMIHVRCDLPVLFLGIYPTKTRVYIYKKVRYEYVLFSEALFSEAWFVKVWGGGNLFISWGFVKYIRLNSWSPEKSRKFLQCSISLCSYNPDYITIKIKNLKKITRY